MLPYPFITSSPISASNEVIMATILWSSKDIVTYCFDEFNEMTDDKILDTNLQTRYHEAPCFSRMAIIHMIEENDE